MLCCVGGQTVHNMVTVDLVRTIRKVTTEEAAEQEVSLMGTKQNLGLTCRRLICQESVGEGPIPESLACRA